MRPITHLFITGIILLTGCASVTHVQQSPHVIPLGGKQVSILFRDGRLEKEAVIFHLNPVSFSYKTPESLQKNASTGDLLCIRTQDGGISAEGGFFFGGMAGAAISSMVVGRSSGFEREENFLTITLLGAIVGGVTGPHSGKIEFFSMADSDPIEIRPDEVLRQNQLTLTIRWGGRSIDLPWSKIKFSRQKSGSIVVQTPVSLVF